MLMQCELFSSPQSPQIHLKSDKLTPPMLEIVIVLNEKDKEEYQGEGSANNSKVKEGGKKKNTLLFFEKRINAWVASQEAPV